jgi:hypothetical protein
MLTARIGLAAVVVLGTLTSAVAQTREPRQPTQGQRQPRTILIDPTPHPYGPPPPPERPYLQPRSEVAPPMDRVQPVAPLSPRIGN